MLNKNSFSFNSAKYLKISFWLVIWYLQNAGVAIGLRGICAHETLFDLFGRVLFVKSRRQRQHEPSATRTIFCEPIIFSSQNRSFLRRQQVGAGGIQFWGVSTVYPPPPGSAPLIRPTIVTPVWDNPRWVVHRFLRWLGFPVRPVWHKIGRASCRERVFVCV